MGGRAFKSNDFNPAQRIPTSKMKDLAKKATETFLPFFERLEPLIGPDILYKKDHGDIDLLGIPKTDTTTMIKGFCEQRGMQYVKQGPMINILFPFEANLHQIDLLFCGKDNFEINKQFYVYPTTMNAVIGHFSRSLYYKFSNKGLFLLITDHKGQRHLFPLTKDLDRIFELLMLERKSDFEIFSSATNFANWIMSSPRFDSGSFLVSKNTRSHRDAKSDPFCTEVYFILSNSNQTASVPNIRVNLFDPEFDIGKALILETKMFVEELRQNILDFCTKKEKKAERIISGYTLIEMGYSPGPIFAIILKDIAGKFDEKTVDIEEIKRYIQDKYPMEKKNDK